MNKLKYLLFLSIIFLSPNAFADTTYDMTSLITSPVEISECGSGSYTGVELNGATHCWNTNTRNYGALSRIYFNLPAPTGTIFESDTAYRLTLYMATNDWRNRFGTVKISPGSNYTNNYVDTFTFVSMKQINVTFTVPYSGSTSFQFLYVDLPATNTNTLITGETNWNLSKVTLTKLTSGSGGGSTTPSGPSTTFDDTGIINNQNENTQDIINNNNTNTQDIIDNNNQNTQDIINNQNKNADKTNELLGSCHKNIFDINNYTYNSARYTKYDYPEQYAVALVSNGNYTGGSFPLIFHLKLKPSTTYYFKHGSSEAETGKLMYYIYRGSPSGTLFYYTENSNDFSFTTPATNYIDYYFQIYVTGTQTSGGRIVLQRPMLFEGSDYSGTYIPYNEEKCTSKLDDTNSAINDVNDSINNSNVDNDVGTGFFDDFTSQDFGLSQIITIPLNTIQGLTSKTCVPLQVPIPFTNSNITLPCMTEIYENKFSTIYNLWKIVSFGIVAYLIAIDIFHIVKGFKDPESDKVEVLDL